MLTGAVAQKADPGQLCRTGLVPAGLLGEPAQRRERGCACNQGYEVPPLHHSITSSARASSVDGTVSPSAFAVLRLIEFKLCRLLNRQFRRFGTLQDSMHVPRAMSE
jgi:hypothetical protein